MKPSELNAIPVVTDEESKTLDYEKLFQSGEITRETDDNFITWFVSKRLNLRWFDGNPTYQLVNAYADLLDESAAFETPGTVELPDDATMIEAIRDALTRWERGIPIRDALLKNAR